MKMKTNVVRARRRCRGFTLVEVITATAVLVTGLMAAFYLIGVGTAINTSARNQSIAYQCAQQQIEMLRNMPYQPISGTSGSLGLQSIIQSTEGPFRRFSGAPEPSYPGMTGYPGHVVALASLPNGRGSLIITNDPTLGNKMKHVTVIVRWAERGDSATNRSRFVTLNTIISSGGMNLR
jgi:prepilin-type N-terminal cleavage/methylation domain-containing protein